MKLLTKTTVYFLLAMIPLLTAGGFVLHHQFSRAINERVDRELVYEEIQWIQYLEAATIDGSSFVLRAPDLLIYPVDKPIKAYPEFADVYGTKAKENVTILFRQLSHVVPVNGIAYQIIIRKSQEQKAVLLGNITWIMLLVFAGFFIMTLIFNWMISKKLWQPFKDSLDKIRNLELQKMETIRFEKTNIEEFNALNTSLNTMTRKIYNDYESIKEFTENAAHEMQTPLAIAQTKMELLLQDDTLKEWQAESLVQATTALTRLSKLNQSLLLLAKIENQQYKSNGVISLTDTTSKYLNLFDEIIKDKQLNVETNFSEDFEIKLHPLLADSLISNLIGNSIKYNIKGGHVYIVIRHNQYCISNTSDLGQLEPQQLFQRFHTSANNDGSSNGLGLAIVKKIIDTHHLQIVYQYEKDIHSFCIYKK